MTEQPSRKVSFKGISVVVVAVVLCVVVYIAYQCSRERSQSKSSPDGAVIARLCNYSSIEGDYGAELGLRLDSGKGEHHEEIK